MKAFNRIFAAVILVLAVLWTAANIILSADGSGDRPYRVEINRLARQMKADGQADLSDCEYVTNIERYGENFYSTESDYVVREINGVPYRFDYKAESRGRTQIVTASKEDFLSFDVNMGEFYLSRLVTRVKGYYTEKLSLIGTDFSISEYSDCLLNGDFDCGVEVVQNVMENAVKYGDGNSISLNFSEEDGCILVTVRNSGCTLADTDLPHVFESFWRGMNAEKIARSGLELYISRKLMRKMNGEIFAEIRDGSMCVTAVFTKV